MIRKYAEIFCWKNVSSFCSAKATHIFSAKNIRILYTESAKTVNKITLNELVKLTTLWTTGPWYFSYLSTETYLVEWWWWWFGVLCPFQHYLNHINGDNERLCALKHRTVMDWIPLLAGFESGTSWSKAVSANHSATRMLHICWVLIRSASASTHNICFHGEIREKFILFSCKKA